MKDFILRLIVMSPLLAGLTLTLINYTPQAPNTDYFLIGLLGTFILGITYMATD